MQATLATPRPARSRALAILATVAWLGAGSPAAAEWNQWRGPRRDGAARDAAVRWPDGLTRLWRVPVGAGQASPVVSGTTVFVFTREGELEVARALDLGTGRELWRRGYRAPYALYPGAEGYGKGPRSTPVVQDGRLFTLGIGGILTAFDAAEGRILWQKDFAGRFPAAAPPFGTSMSPLFAAGHLVVHAGGHDGGALIAFDPATGAERWVLEGDGPSYSSPILATLGGQEQLVVQVHRKLIGVDPRAGSVLWSVPFVTPCDQNIVTPLAVGDRLVVSSLDKGTMAIEVQRSDRGWAPRVAWHTTAVSMYMSSPVLAGEGRVVGLSHRKRGQFFALDAATGDVLWLSAGDQGENAALIAAGQSLLALKGDGTLLALPTSATAFTPLRSYEVAESATFAHPVPTSAGLLVKDAAGLTLFGAGESGAAVIPSAATAASGGSAPGLFRASSGCGAGRESRRRAELRVERGKRFPVCLQDPGLRRG